jgi:hypothetical protein
MKTFLQGFGGTLIFLGLIAAAGSAGDCDGKCMDQANDIGTMLFIVFWAMVSMGLGAVLINLGLKLEN